MVQLENEIWKPTFVNPFYLISNKGRVRNLDRPIWCKQNNSYSIRKGKLLKPSNKNTKKYWRIGIPPINATKKDRRVYSIHRLVATAFIPNPLNLPQINHIDGNKDNNCVENLEWCDNDYNQHHAWEHHLRDVSKMSAHSSFRKLTEEQVSFIKTMWSSIDTSKAGNKTRFNKALAQMFNLKSPNTIKWITSGGTNKFFNQDIVQTTNYNSWLAEFNMLWEASKPKKTKIDYARELGVSYSYFCKKYKEFGENIDTTINYIKQRKVSSKSCSGKEIAKA